MKALRFIRNLFFVLFLLVFCGWYAIFAGNSTDQDFVDRMKKDGVIIDATVIEKRETPSTRSGGSGSQYLKVSYNRSHGTAETKVESSKYRSTNVGDTIQIYFIEDAVVDRIAEKSYAEQQFLAPELTQLSSPAFALVLILGLIFAVLALVLRQKEMKLAKSKTVATPAKSKP
jgi:hypothetical protein